MRFDVSIRAFLQKIYKIIFFYFVYHREIVRKRKYLNCLETSAAAIDLVESVSRVGLSVRRCLLYLGLEGAV